MELLIDTQRLECTEFTRDLETRVSDSDRANWVLHTMSATEVYNKVCSRSSLASVPIRFSRIPEFSVSKNISADDASDSPSHHCHERHHGHGQPFYSPIRLHDVSRCLQRRPQRMPRLGRRKPGNCQPHHLSMVRLTPFEECVVMHTLTVTARQRRPGACLPDSGLCDHSRYRVGP